MTALLGACSAELSGLMKLAGIRRRDLILVGNCGVSNDGVAAGAVARGVAAGAVARGELAGRRVLIARTGMGGERAAGAAGRILERFPVERAVSLGFAGALDQAAREGDVYVCPVWRSAGGGTELPLDIGWAEGALEDLESRGWVFHTGAGLSTDGFVGHREAKRRLRERHGADIVDMETYRLALEASRRGVPLLSVRVVSDAADRRPPDLDGLVRPEDCRLRWARTLARLAAHPQELPPLLSFAAAARRTAGVLTRFVADLVAALQPGGETGGETA